MVRFRNEPAIFVPTAEFHHPQEDQVTIGGTPRQEQLMTSSFEVMMDQVNDDEAPINIVSMRPTDRSMLDYQHLTISASDSTVLAC